MCGKSIVADRVLNGSNLVEDGGRHRDVAEFVWRQEHVNQRIQPRP